MDPSAAPLAQESEDDPRVPQLFVHRRKVVPNLLLDERPPAHFNLVVVIGKADSKLVVDEGVEGFGVDVAELVLFNLSAPLFFLFLALFVCFDQFIALVRHCVDCVEESRHHVLIELKELHLGLVVDFFASAPHNLLVVREIQLWLHFVLPADDRDSVVFQEVEAHDPHLRRDGLTRLKLKVSPVVRKPEVLRLLAVNLDVNQLVDEEYAVWHIHFSHILLRTLRGFLVLLSLSFSRDPTLLLLVNV